MTPDLFYQTNKDFDWKLRPIPDTLTTDVERARWIFKQPIGWIELDIGFDIAAWANESIAACSHFVNHREGPEHKGWQACCIHGLAIDKTGTDPAAPISEYHWTELAEETPAATQFWKQFPFEHLVRVRYMLLGPNGYVGPHNDSPPGVDLDTVSLMDHILPINIAIVHPDNCYMTLKDYGTVPWKAGKVILVNITNDHSVVNYSNQYRLHMIGHGLVGSRIEEFCNLIVRSYNKQYERNSV